MYSPNQSKEKILFDGTFESGDFSNWTVVNDTVNKWVVGNDTAYEGTYSGYISNDGSKNTYTGTAATVSHIYFDVKFPRFLSFADLEFEWRCLGEPKFDYMRVSMVAPGVTPQAGTALPNKNSIGTSKYKRDISTSKGTGKNKKTTTETVYEYQASPAWRKEYIPLDLSGIRNRKKRFVFSWINSADQNTFNPPIALDNVRVSTTMPLKYH
ncbi:MAG TPA: hypothetical protein DF712_05275 [Balneola sp.]|nr:hypothetical protein [Balneola sp.]